MIHRDLLVQAYQMNCNYYIDLLIKDEAIKTPAKLIVTETCEYLKKAAKGFDDVLEQYSIFLHKGFT